MRVVTLSATCGISTLISRYSRKITAASVSRMLTSRSAPERGFSSFFVARRHRARMAFSSQDIIGVSR